MADAARPETYAPLMEEVDLLYQDVAQPDQTSVALRNSVFLRSGGTLILMLKTRSIDVTKEPVTVLADVEGRLAGAGFAITASEWLEPYHRDHAAIICRKG
jgi:fibrillarin-like pre-rRNA processing protein